MLIRAVVVDEPGGPEALRVGERPVRAPGPGELRVRVRAATVNPADFVVRALGPGFGRPDQAPPPWTPGMEGAGTVESAGPEVALAAGTRVAFAVNPDRPEGGAQADLVVVPVASVAVVPDRLGDAEAATLPMNGLTARVALDALALPAGAVLGVIGGAGALGGYVIQLARRAGLRVVADAKPQDEELLRTLGADAVVPRSADVAAAFRAEVPEGVDGLVDAAVLDDAVLGAIRDGGALVTVHGWPGPSPAVRGIRVEPVLVHAHLHRTADLVELVELAARGELTPRIAAELPPEQVAEAHRRLEAGGVRGRLVLRFAS